MPQRHDRRSCTLVSRSRIVAGILARQKQSPNPARPRSARFSAAPISADATVAVANIGKNGVRYTFQVSQAVTDQPGGYSAAREKEPEDGHYRNPRPCMSRSTRVEGLRRLGYAFTQQVDLAVQCHDQTVDPFARIEWNS